MKKFLILISAIFFAFSCDSDNAEELQPVEAEPETEQPTTTTDPVNAKVTYENDIVPILVGDCLRCHGEQVSSGAPPGTEWTTFENVKSNANLIRARINSMSNPMPPGRLIAQSARNKFDQWIEDGLLEK